MSWNIGLLNPLHAIVGISLLAVIAALAGRVIPFYRRELAVEDATRLTPLDGLRGILCFSVMYCHGAITWQYFDTRDWQPTASKFYTLLGHSAVAFFFCVTAFLFWSRVLARGGQLEPWPFLRGRIFRIVPLYAFACLVALLIVGRYIDWRSRATLRGMVEMFSMGLRPWPRLPSADVNLVNAGVTWSLPYEWAFYFALPALALMARGPIRLLFIAAALYVLIGMGPVMFFLPGILAAHAARDAAIVRRLQRADVTIIVVLSVAAMPVFTWHGFGYLALPLTTVAFIPLACGNSIFGLLNTIGLRLMGLVSYSVYMLHGISLYLARPILLRIKTESTYPVLTYWTAVFALACLVLFTCMITYRFIELPFIQMEKRLRRRRVETAAIVHSLPAAQEQADDSARASETAPGSVASE